MPLLLESADPLGVVLAVIDAPPDRLDLLGRLGVDVMPAREDAELGIVDGRARLAWAYRTGNGCAPDLDEAERWSRRPRGLVDHIVWQPGS